MTTTRGSDHSVAPEEAESIRRRSRVLLDKSSLALHQRTDRLFAGLMIFQYIVGIAAALWISPQTWLGTQSQLHIHVWAAIILGGVITALPVALAILRPGQLITRHTIAAAQAMTSALLIHLTGGRIETHFHVFGSLAFLAFYRDWRVIITASTLVALDHLLRGVFWPQSVFGIISASPWRWLEHAGWVVFEDVFLIQSCVMSKRDLRGVSDRQARLEFHQEVIEREVVLRTEELQIEHSQRREAEAYSKQILQNAADPIVVISDRGVVQSASDSVMSVFGWESKDLIGHSIFELLPRQGPTEEKDVFECFQIGRESDISVINRVDGKRKDGEIAPIELAVSRMKGSNPPTFVLIVRDLSSRLQLEEQLSSARRLEAIGQLAAGVAHEINTPTQFVGDNTRFLEDGFRDLMPVLKKAEDLAQAVLLGTDSSELADALKTALDDADVEYLGEEIPRAIEQSLDGIERVRNIVLSMKEFSHPGAKGISDLDLNRAIEATISVATNEWKYVAEMKTDFDPDLPPVPCQPGEINQVILNIIVNAAHAIADVVGDGGGGLGQITVSTGQVDGCAEMRITDTGHGIPEFAREKLFDPFFTTKEVGKGTGQGLSIAHAVVVTMHGGSLEFETEIGEGTTFVIRLPLERRAVEEVPA